MTQIYVPSGGPGDWKKILAEPDKQWKRGFSAMALAESWEAAHGLPTEVAGLFGGHPDFHNGTPELLVAFPEWQVPLPGGRRASQNDVFALVRCDGRTVATMVEGKVDEPFGPALDAWLSDASDGKRTRLDHIRAVLAMTETPPGDVRYQLLHRTASAVIEARRFGTGAAAMIVHSFSTESLWYEDFERFCALLGATSEIGRLSCVTAQDGMPLYLGWAKGDKKFLKG